MILLADDAFINDVLFLLQTSFLNLSKLCKTLCVLVFSAHILKPIVHAFVFYCIVKPYKQLCCCGVVGILYLFVIGV